MEIDLICEGRTDALNRVSHPGNASWAVGYPYIYAVGYPYIHGRRDGLKQ